MAKLFDANTARTYLNGPPRQVPGFGDLHRMAIQLLAERVPAAGRLLVVGAGGGLELRGFAEAQPQWLFDGVDPSSDMLELAARTAAPFADRIRLHQGKIEAVPHGPFDGATALLVFHFLSHDERLETLRQIRERLVEGAPLILVHLSFPQDEPERSVWIERHARYGGMEPEKVSAAADAMKAQLTILDPDEDVRMMNDAGFADVRLFYAGLALRGWVGYA